jgi:hypothetical protein
MANTHSLDLEAGSSQYASRADTASLSITGDWTIECWVKIEDAPGTGVSYAIVSKYDSTGSNDRSYYIAYTDVADTEYLYAIIDQDGDGVTRDVVRTAYTLTPGTWYHIAITCDVSEATATTFEFFVNGSSIGNGSAVESGNASSVYDSAAPFQIGALHDPQASFFDGQIDDVRVWNDIRTGGEISANYQQELTGSEAGLVGYWKLNNDYTDSQSSGLNDLTGNGTFVTDVPDWGATGNFFAIL